MTYSNAPACRPQVGGFYNLRAGLRAFIFDSYELYGIRYFRGNILDQVPVVIFWYPNGCYAPGGAHHELDLIGLTE